MNFLYTHHSPQRCGLYLIKKSIKERTYMLYHLHFNEDNVPYDDEPFEHDIYFQSNKKIKITNIFEEIENLKAQMDDEFYSESDTYDNYDNISDDENIINELFEAYADYGWDEKIDAAFEIVKNNHPEYNIQIIEDIMSYSTSIN